MLKRKLAFPALIALVITGFPSNILAAGLRGGAFGAAPPASLVPASADVYAELNRTGALGDDLNALVRTYQSHPGTSAALHRLRMMMGPQAMGQFTSMLASFTDRVGVFATLPTNASAPPQAAVIAQLRPSSYMNGGNPLAGLATFSPSASYRGTSIYRVTFSGGGSGYGAIVAGDGVVAGDMASVRSVIDAGTFHAPSLATDADFNTTLAQIPAFRTMTLYVGRHFLARAAQAARSAAPGTMPGMASIGAGSAALRALQRPYAVGVTAYPTGISVVSSAIPRTSPLYTTPNAGANLVGDSAIVYVSLANLAGLLQASGVLPAGTLAQAKAQTGIDIGRDVLPLISREVVVDINNESSPLLTAGLAASSNNGSNLSLGSIPQLPGSLELATEVSDQASAQASVNNIVGALTHAAGGSGAASGALFSPVTLPDGSTGHVVTALPSFGYTFRRAAGHTFLVISSNLAADVRASSKPLAASPDYQAALANVPGTGAPTYVNYTSVSRLLALVDKLLAYPQISKAVGASAITMYQQDAEPLIAPFRNVVVVSRAYGAQETQTQSFITVR